MAQQAENIIDVNSNGVEEVVPEEQSFGGLLRRNFSWRSQDSEEITVVAAAGAPQSVPTKDRRGSLSAEELSISTTVDANGGTAEKPKVYDGLFKKKDKAPVTSVMTPITEEEQPTFARRTSIKDLLKIGKDKEMIPPKGEEESAAPGRTSSIKDLFKLGKDKETTSQKDQEESATPNRTSSIKDLFKLGKDKEGKVKADLKSPKGNGKSEDDGVLSKLLNKFKDSEINLAQLEDEAKEVKSQTEGVEASLEASAATDVKSSGQLETITTETATGGGEQKEPEDAGEDVGLDLEEEGNFEPANKWEAEVLAGGATQEDFMYKDECIVVDENDNVIGHDTKYNCHRFVPGQPRGILHRAFSVFLFNSKGELLLQQRAASKITFPSVWTNTCCSHQLYAQEPTEMDEPDAIKGSVVMGAKRAAVRKLAHELGIKADQVPLEKFKFLTRMHYYATDAVTHGPHTVWGEHEIDYILFIQADVDLKPNPEEVDEVKWVDQDELEDMMESKSNGLLWSPWFQFIMEKWGHTWWADLKTTLETEKYVDTENIYRFDPPPEHRSCAGISGIVQEGLKNDEGSKQGAYGKIPTHSESKLSQLSRLDEVNAAIYYKTFGGMKRNLKTATEDDKYCESMLKKVSRSFAAVILQLPKEMTMSVLIFYLVLRGLDTIEDDMASFDDLEEKKRHLRNFHKTALEDENFSMKDVGEGDEKDLLENFGAVTRVFKKLKPYKQVIISDITKKMGAGMAEYVGADLGQGTSTIDDYNKYCHYVAGLVGEGLSRLFAASGKEDSSLRDELELSNSMGLFLQKTNIIRDFLEDYVDGRAWWPREIWAKYAETKQLGEFVQPQFRQNGLNCLNDLVTDALMHGSDCLKYMEKLKNNEVFRFCAIPQVMAIATLDKVYNNPEVFTGVAKIRKGLAVRMIVDTKSEKALHYYFNSFARSIKSRIPKEDPNAQRTHEVCDLLIELTADKSYKFKRNSAFFGFLLVVALCAAVILLQYYGIIDLALAGDDSLAVGEACLVGFCLIYIVVSNSKFRG